MSFLVANLCFQEAHLKYILSKVPAYFILWHKICQFVCNVKSAERYGVYKRSTPIPHSCDTVYHISMKTPHNYIATLKADNQRLWPIIEKQVQSIFTYDLLPISPAFADDLTILTDYLRVPGRGIGGSLVLKCAQLYTSHTPTQSELSLAAASEIMNAAILIFDDVADNADFRKRLPTPHRRYTQIDGKLSTAQAKSQAMQLGMLTTLMATLLAEQAGTDMTCQPAIAELQHSALLVTAGQLLEARVASDPQYQSEEQILAVHAHKTGWYSFEGPMRIGLILAGASQYAQDYFGTIAQHLGMAFQLQDDVNGVLGDPSVTGKPNTDDVRLGLYTMLYHLTMQKCTQTERAAICTIYGKPRATQREIDIYRSVVRRHKVDTKLSKRAQQHIAQASTLLQQEWSPDYNPELRIYIESIIRFLRSK